MPEVKTRPAKQGAPAAPEKGEVVKFAPPRLPWHPAIEQRYGVTQSGWYALVGAVFPGAKTVEGVLMALAYCKQRGLDVFRRPVHVVSIWDKEKRTYVDSVWPGIGELRITAHRTGIYAGCDETEWGPTIEKTFEDWVGRDDQRQKKAITLRFPEWGRLTVYRMVSAGPGQPMMRVPFPGPKVHWLESYGTIGASSLPNEMWLDRTEDQFEKCVEAAALRKAFPEELGGQIAVEELRHVAPSDEVVVPPRPTRESVQEELRQEAAKLAALARNEDRPAEPVQQREVPEATQPPAPADASPAPSETPQEAETGEEAEDGWFAVHDADGNVAWGPRDDSDGFADILMAALRETTGRDQLAKLYATNAGDLARLTDEQLALVRDTYGEMLRAFKRQPPEV